MTVSTSTSSSISEALRRAVVHPTGGVAGLVDELLTLCQEHGLQLDWQADRCRVRSHEGDWEALIDVPLRKSLFRAILARIAALCNERTPNSVSPYGGQAEFSAAAKPSAIIRVRFANTLAEQRLELTTDHGPMAEASPRHGPFEASGLVRGDGIKSAGLRQNHEIPAVLRHWADLWTRFESSRIGSLHPAEWSSVQGLIDAMTRKLAMHCRRMEELLRASNRQLAPLEDPLTVDLGLHRWLAADREESYSDWLAWVLSQLPNMGMLYRVLGLHCLPELERAKIQPMVQREVFVPFGHMGSKGRLDLLIKLETRTIMVEVKTGSADESDTDKHPGYIQSVPKDTAAVLIATDGELPDYNGFELRSWASVSQELRKLIPDLIRDRGITVAALILGFVGAVEQNLLGFHSWMAKSSVMQQVGMFDSRLLDHLQGALRGPWHE